ncbi:MAG TPA: hypothetical protein VF471_03390 [Pseudoxanthomonas sp.]
MRAARSFFYAAMAVIAIAACSKEVEKMQPPGTPGAEYDLDQKELVAVIELANHGDMSSIKRLVNYYSWVHSDPSKAIPWLRAAASQGDVASMQDLAGRISVSGIKSDCVEAHSLLETALVGSNGPLRASIQEDMDLLTNGNNGRGACVKWLKAL